MAAGVAGGARRAAADRAGGAARRARAVADRDAWPRAARDGVRVRGAVRLGRRRPMAAQRAAAERRVLLLRLPAIDRLRSRRRLHQRLPAARPERQGLPVAAADRHRLRPFGVDDRSGDRVGAVLRRRPPGGAAAAGAGRPGRDRRHLLPVPPGGVHRRPVLRAARDVVLDPGGAAVLPGARSPRPARRWSSADRSSCGTRSPSRR